jgi:hypothetical protein
MPAQHTPTHSALPWSFGRIEDTAIVNANGFVIHRPKSSNEFEHKDLRFIVKCVNEREGLIRLLKICLQNYQEGYSIPADRVSEAIADAEMKPSPTNREE